MDRYIWTQRIGKEGCPPWPCSFCKKGSIGLLKETLVIQETAESIRAHGQDEWDPEWITYIFTAWAECSHSTCKQMYAISGTGGVGFKQTDEDDWDWVDYFSPKLCNPMPDIIPLPSRTPKNVLDELRASFSLFWLNRESCAGKIRVALECLMDHLGIPKKRKTKNGKFTELSLHERIEIYTTKESAIGAQLMALKWLGNTGSHNGDINTADLLDAFEILEHTLGEIIGQRSARVATLVKTLTKKHAPKRP